jgi:hypothetical protein
MAMAIGPVNPPNRPLAARYRSFDDDILQKRHVGLKAAGRGHADIVLAAHTHGHQVIVILVAGNALAKKPPERLLSWWRNSIGRCRDGPCASKARQADEERITACGYFLVYLNT